MITLFYRHGSKYVHRVKNHTNHSFFRFKPEIRLNVFNFVFILTNKIKEILLAFTLGLAVGNTSIS